ncbi:carboxymuconolactone decarboxylase family protein [Pseudotabrizicola algicola]|uniref:Carboxymuconolactone decarboxylase family protein n=1 Tax=Pseudotabrizicola algicola TaxID=2709381 RepID=A0A6B3RRZ4_9RHOB|nr:carboxymuconolactone decarboxylase family protein [Pseudotabrizicola algicola]NEX45879.1 carboxymuconolactone decarboxylase family protein [Pseudotabrizicola algicola]
MTYRSKITAMRSELRSMNKLIPQTTAAFADLSKTVKDSGPLAVKEKEYVALAIAITQRCEPCITFHVEALMKAGASRDELGGVLEMCIQMGGGPALMYAAHALACWDELAAPA